MKDQPPAVVRVIVPALACMAWAVWLFRGVSLALEMAGYEVAGTPSPGEVLLMVGVPLVALVSSVGIAVMSARKAGCLMPLLGLVSLLGLVACTLAFIDAI